MKGKLVADLILFAALFTLPCGDCFARQLEDWPYDKLFKNADLVVIVKPSAVRDATEKDKAIPPDNEDYLVGVVTSFKVIHVVKGEYKEKKLDLVHFKIKEGRMIGNGPLLVSFHTKETKIRGDSWSSIIMESEYMLFLKKQKDGQFTFVSGQFDPELSVKQVLSPLP
jgi:hypothetical protein